jgi:hypothetical protein
MSRKITKRGGGGTDSFFSEKSGFGMKLFIFILVLAVIAGIVNTIVLNTKK